MNLKNVTLICVEGSTNIDSINDSIKALLISSKNINFGEIVLLSAIRPPLPEFIRHYTIPSMSWLEYNQFIVSNLTEYVHTDYCILIQPDGFIINSNVWTDEFLNYDYIGHVWDFINLAGWHLPGVDPEVVARKGPENLNRVGNGGFSLRSKKLLNETATIPVKCEKGEDAFICNDQFDYLTEKGIVFGTVEIAKRFSEDPNEHFCRSYQPTFGFHGDKNLIHIL